MSFALGGFFDGVLLHQILQWHHLLMYVVALASGVMLLHARRCGARNFPASEIFRLSSSASARRMARGFRHRARDSCAGATEGAWTHPSGSTSGAQYLDRGRSNGGGRPTLLRSRSDACGLPEWNG